MPLASGWKGTEYMAADEWTVDEIMEKIRDGLTGEYNVDIVYLEAEADRYRGTAQGRQIESEIADLAYEIMPEDKRAALSRMMYLDGKRLDSVFAQARQLTEQNKIEESFKLTEALYTKIRMNYRESETEIYLSFRNTLEHQLYLVAYRPTKKLVRPVFDLSQMILLHGYNLLELHRAEEAVKVIGDAIRYNPMNTDAYFELAECYKVLRQPEGLFSVIQETLEIAVTPAQIARCFSNMGFYCVETEDYDRAVCFYYESLIYWDNPVITSELHHIHTRTGKKLKPPSRDEVNAAFEHYHMKPQANEEVVAVITALAKEAIENGESDGTTFYLRMLSGLLGDPEGVAKVFRQNDLAIEPSEDAKKVLGTLANTAIQSKNLPAARVFLHVLYDLAAEPDVKEKMEHYDQMARERRTKG